MKKVLFSLIAVLAMTLGASALQIPSYINQSAQFITNATLTVGTNSTTTITNNQWKPMAIQPGVGFAFQPIFRGTNEAANTNVAFYINFSLDGTNYSTTNGVVYTEKLDGTNTVVGYTNIPASVCDNALWAQLTKVVVADGTNSAVSITGTRWTKRIPPLDTVPVP